MSNLSKEAGRLNAVKNLFRFFKRTPKGVHATGNVHPHTQRPPISTGRPSGEVVKPTKFTPVGIGTDMVHEGRPHAQRTFGTPSPVVKPSVSGPVARPAGGIGSGTPGAGVPGAGASAGAANAAKPGMMGTAGKWLGRAGNAYFYGSMLHDAYNMFSGGGGGGASGYGIQPGYGGMPGRGGMPDYGFIGEYNPLNNLKFTNVGNYQPRFIKSGHDKSAGILKGLTRIGFPLLRAVGGGLAGQGIGKSMTGQDAQGWGNTITGATAGLLAPRALRSLPKAFKWKNIKGVGSPALRALSGGVAGQSLEQFTTGEEPQGWGSTIAGATAGVLGPRALRAAGGLKFLPKSMRGKMTKYGPDIVDRYFVDPVWKYYMADATAGLADNALTAAGYDSSGKAVGNALRTAGGLYALSPHMKLPFGGRAGFNRFLKNRSTAAGSGSAWDKLHNLNRIIRSHPTRTGALLLPIGGMSTGMLGMAGTFGADALRGKSENMLRNKQILEDFGKTNEGRYLMNRLGFSEGRVPSSISPEQLELILGKVQSGVGKARSLGSMFGNQNLLFDML